MKLIHFADVHLGMENYGKIDPQTGLNSRLGDFLKSFDAITEYAIKNKADLAIFAGDAYKTRDPSPTYQREFAKRIYKIAAAGIPVAMVVGNHDFPNAAGKADTLEIFPTLSVPNIHIFQKADLQTIKTKSGLLQIAGLPWFTRSQVLEKTELTRGTIEENNQKAAKKISEKIEYLSSKIDPRIPSVLIAHASVEGAVYGSERQVMIGSEVVLPLKTLKNSRFNYIALGHLHKFQEIIKNPPIIYSGSIERVDFGEEKEPKGFVAIEINSENKKILTTPKFIKLPTRPFISIHAKISDDEKNPTEKILKIIKIHNLKDSVVKLQIEVSAEKSLEVREMPIREALKNANFIAGINKEIKKDNRTKTTEGYSDELANLDPLGLLEKYLKTKKVRKSRMEILKKTTQKLLEEEVMT